MRSNVIFRQVPVSDRHYLGKQHQQPRQFPENGYMEFLNVIREKTGKVDPVAAGELKTRNESTFPWLDIAALVSFSGQHLAETLILSNRITVSRI